MLKINKNLWQTLRQFQTLLVLVLMVVAMTVLSDRFLTEANGSYQAGNLHTR